MVEQMREAPVSTGALLRQLPGAWLRALRPRPRASLDINDDFDSGARSVRYGLQDPVGQFSDQRYGLVGNVIPAMQSAINLLSNTMAHLPRQVVDMRGDPMVGHPTTDLLNRFDPRWPPSAVWEYLERSALQFGVGYAWIARFPGGERLYPCDPVLSDYRLSADRTRLTFSLQPVSGPPRTNVMARDVLIVVGDGYNGVRGLSPISAYAVTMGVLGHSGRHLLSTLQNGMHIAGVVQSDAEVGQGMGWDLPRISELRRKLVELFAGTTRAGGVPVLPPGFHFHPVPYNAVDIELVKLLELSIEDVCRIYRVPPRLIYHYRSGIRYTTDAESSNAEFARYSIMPRARSLGDMVSSQLLSFRALNDDGVRIRFDTDELYAGTVSQRIAAIDQGVSRAGVLTPNEGRDYLRTGRLPRLDPIEGADELLAPKGGPAENATDAGTSTAPLDDTEE